MLTNYNHSNPSFIFLELIGQGTFGNVYKVYDQHLCKCLALKRTVKKGCIISREFKMLSEVKDCEFCIQLIDIFYTINNDKVLMQNLVFDYMPISLGKVLRNNFTKKARMSHSEIVCIMRQLLMGLEYIHKKSIIHRDIKPDNILLTLDFPYKLKICDFGSAKKLSDSSTPYIVSRFYRAPELIFCNTQYDTKVDIWSAGCLFLELYTGFPIFRGNSDGNQFIQIAGILGPLRREEVEELATGRIRPNVISKTLAIGKKQNLIELFSESPKPEVVEDLVYKMLQWLPKERISATECLLHEFFW